MRPFQFIEFFAADTQMVVKATIDTYEKDGDTFFRIHKMTVKGQVGDGWVKMTAKNPELQFGGKIRFRFPLLFKQ